MSLATRIADLATAIGTDIKALFGRALPAGGAAGQVLAKTAATDYAVGWVNQSGGGGGSVQKVELTVATAVQRQAQITMAVPGTLATQTVICQLVPNADWDADDLADLSVRAEAATDQIIFTITRDGPLVGSFAVAYQIG
jgi:hypothetical protein